MHLAAKGRREEELLFRLLGIASWQGERDAAVLVGKADVALLDDADIIGVVLPDAEDPEAESRRLARRLACAVGVGEIGY